MEAVANWMWQGIVIAIAATALVQATRRFGATARYRLWWTAMAIVLLLPFATAPSLSLTPAPRIVTQPASSSDAAAPMQWRVAAPPSWAANSLLAVWAAWLTISVGRVAAAAIGLRRARRAAQPFPPSREARLENWMALSHRGRRARLVVSDAVRYAAVLGGRAPLIAIAPAVAASLDDWDLDRIVVHEWAHVQRRDDRDRLLQLAVRAVAGLHPAVWWLDRRIHADREAACDDWTVNLTGSARAYAMSLTRLATIDSAPRRDILLPAAIVPSELSLRVMSLLDDKRTTSTRRGNAWTAAIVPALLALALAVSDLQLIALENESAAVGRSSLEMAPPTIERPNAVDVPLKIVLKSPAASASIRLTSQRPTPPPETTPVAASTPSLPVGSPPDESGPEADADASRLFSVTAPSVLAGPPSTVLTQPGIVPLPLRADDASKTPWGAAADAGVQVGRGSQKAAVATAGFFSKLGKSIARSF